MRKGCRKKKNLPKTAALRVHAKKRALERYNLVLTRKDLHALVVAIQQGKAEFVERQSLRVTRWRIVRGDVLLNLVYDKNRQEIITFLPA